MLILGRRRYRLIYKRYDMMCDTRGWTLGGKLRARNDRVVCNLEIFLAYYGHFEIKLYSQSIILWFNLNF